MSDIIHVTDNDFAEKVLKAELPVLVDYWAEWCGPCKMIAPVLDVLADEYDGKLLICKIDISSNPETPQTFGVRNIPTLMIFNKGEAVATKVGAVSKSQLAAFIDATLS